MRLLAHTLWIAASGCTWVSPADFETRKTKVDDDGDGFNATTDCNDKDKSINPDADETWYDGIDQDCAGDDDYDADADGWVPSEYEGLQTENVPGTGTLPPGDCDDLLAEVNPAQPDEWRDGIDSDCQGEDDYDVDGDGYVPDEWEGFATAYVDGSGQLPANDCDDANANVNPDATDVWRDGIDDDCEGNDDYDVDRDGFVRDEDEGLVTVYVPDSGDLPAGDCDDESADVNPGMAEVWYDDVDNDCDPLTDDDDQDSDGHLTLDAGGGDCDDTRDDVNPDATEILSDAVDHDCDGDAETFLIGPLEDSAPDISSLNWVFPHDGVWSANSSYVFFSVASERVDVTRPSSSGGSTTVEYYDSAIAFGWDLTNLPAGPIEFVDWQRNAGADPVFTLTDGHDFIATDDAVFGATGLQLPTGRALRMGGYNLATGQRFGISYRLTQTSSVPYADFSDISLGMDDDGTLHAVGCEAQTSWMQYMRATPASLQSTNFDEVTAWDARTVPLCRLHFYESDGGRIIGRTADGVQEWSFDPAGDPPALVEQSLYNYTATDLVVPRDGSNPWIIVADSFNQGIAFIEPDGTETMYPVGTPPRSVHAQFDPFEPPATGEPDLIVTYVDGFGDAFLLIGNPTAGWDQYDLPVDFTANDALAWADPSGEFVLVAVSNGPQTTSGGTSIPGNLAFGMVAR